MEESDDQSDTETHRKDIFDDGSESNETDTETDEDDQYDSDRDTDDGEDQPITEQILEQVFQDLEEQKDELIDDLKIKGYNENNVDQEAHKRMLPSYQKAFRKKFANWIIKLDKFRREPLYKLIMETAKELRDEGLGREESIEAAVHRRKFKVNKYVPAELDSDSAMEDESD